MKTNRITRLIHSAVCLLLATSAWALNIGENVTLTGKWQDENAAEYPMNGVKVTVRDQLMVGGAADITGFLIGGTFSFVVPRTGYVYDVILTAHFPGVDASGNVVASGGAGAFDVSNPATGNVITETVGSNIVSFTSVKGGTLVLQSGDTWTVHHGMADMVREARRRLSISKNAFVVDFPHPGISSYSPTTTHVRINLQDRFDWDVIAHEFGHAVADETNAVNSVAGGSHDGSNQYTVAANAGTLGNKTKSLGLAFNEGFGTWIGGALLERSDFKGQYPRVGDGKYTDTEDSNIDNTYEDNTTQTFFGDDTENALFQLFWDLHDSNNEANKRTTKADGLRDRTALGVPGVWALFNGSSAVNISDFWKNGFLPNKTITDFLPGVGSAISSPPDLEKALAAAETFVEFGVAPLLFKPKRGTKIELLPKPSVPNAKFEWSQEATNQAAAGAHPDLALNKFQLVIYSSDLETELFHKPGLAGTSYTLTNADLTVLKNAVDALKNGGKEIASVKAVLIGESDKTAPTTGPYLSNGIELLIQDYNRAVVAVVDSSGSNTSTDPSDQRVVASKESIRRLVSQADATNDPTKVPDIAAAIDFDSSVRTLSVFADPDSVEPTLDAIDSSGGTSIDGGLNAGIALLDNIGAGGFESFFKDRAAILLFTDGQNNTGDGPVIAAIANATSKGIRVHYGFLNPFGSPKPSSTQEPEPGAPAVAPLAAAPIVALAAGSPTTIQEAVLESGGVFAVISDAESQNAFVQQVFAQGLTNNDEDDAPGGKIVGQTISAAIVSGGSDEASFEFFGTKFEQARVIVESSDFQPAVTLLDKDGGILAFQIDTDQDGRVEIPLTLPYTGNYSVQVYPNDGNTGVFTVFVDVQNIRFDYLRVGVQSNAYSRLSAFSRSFGDTAVGKYSGLLRPTSGTRKGSFKASVRKTGKFTGSLNIDGTKVAISGTLSASGSFFGSFKTKPFGTISVFLRLTQSSEGNKLEGSVTATGFSLDIDSDQAAFNKKTNPFARPNVFTFVMPSEQNSNIPGDGYGVASVSAAGSVRLVGTLGDHKKFSLSSTLSQEATFPVQLPIYPVRKGGLPGGLFGELAVRDTVVGNIDGTLNWAKPPQPKDKIYPGGFSGQIPFIGSAFEKPAKNVERILTLGNFTGNLRAAFGSGNLLPTPGDHLLTLGLDNKVTVVGPNPSTKFALKFNTNNGLFTGSFIHFPTAKAKTVKFAGAVLQSQSRATGHFVGTGQTGFCFFDPYDDTDVRISSPIAATATVGLLFTYQIQTVNEPFLYGASGLPEGFILDEGTGAISGTPQVAGTVHATVFVIDITGRKTSQEITITVSAP